MSAGTRACLCCALLLVGVSAEQKNITADRGQQVILPCRAPNSNQIRAVVWARPDLEDEHVYLYRDGRFDPGEQNPIYRNRVELQDSQMKDGDVSLILKNMTVDDAGRYECRVIQRETSGSTKTLNSVYLRVAPPGEPGGRSGSGSPGLVLHPYGPVLLLAVAAFLF